MVKEKSKRIYLLSVNETIIQYQASLATCQLNLFRWEAMENRIIFEAFCKGCPKALVESGMSNEMTTTFFHLSLVFPLICSEKFWDFEEFRSF